MEAGNRRKCRAVYDWLTANVTYDSHAENDQSSYGALIDRRCVCGGYTNAFMSLGMACGLEVKYLITSDHSFNLVKISGKWYAVDATQKYYKNRSTVGVYYLCPFISIPRGRGPYLSGSYNPGTS